MPRIIRIELDVDICLWHGLCMGECREVFFLDKMAPHAVVQLHPDAERYYIDKDEEIRSAARACPVDCIRIIEASE